MESAISAEVSVSCSIIFYKIKPPKQSAQPSLMKLHLNFFCKIIPMAVQLYLSLIRSLCIY